MSAPDTNVDKLERRHSPSLFGIRGVLIFAAVMMLLWGGFGLINPDEDASAAVSAEGAAEQSSDVATDVYAPGTNSSTTPAASD